MTYLPVFLLFSIILRILNVRFTVLSLPKVKHVLFLNTIILFSDGLYYLEVVKEFEDANVIFKNN